MLCEYSNAILEMSKLAFKIKQQYCDKWMYLCMPNLLFCTKTEKTIKYIKGFLFILWFIIQWFGQLSFWSKTSFIKSHSAQGLSTLFRFYISNSGSQWRPLLEIKRCVRSIKQGSHVENILEYKKSNVMNIYFSYFLHMELRLMTWPA